METQQGLYMKKSRSLNNEQAVLNTNEFNLDDEVVVDYVVDVDNMISNYVDRYGYSKESFLDLITMIVDHGHHQPEFIYKVIELYNKTHLVDNDLYK